jgi:hypothetical protein
MEQAINYYERLDRLEKDSLAKRVILLEQIRIYDEALSIKNSRYYDLLEATETKRLKQVLGELDEETREWIKKENT